MNHKTTALTALTGLTLTAGGYLGGHAARPAESAPAVTVTAFCTEMQRPDDPAGVIGDAWPDIPTCDKLAASATIHSPASIALRTAAEDIRSAQVDIINAAHPGVPPTQARLTIQSVRGDLAAALDQYAEVAVGAMPVDYTQVR